VVRLMSGRVAGKVALITGAARAQRRADALRLAEKTGRRAVSGIVTEF